MRGKGKTTDLIIRGTGITPAYAGKSSIALPFVSMKWDHPRLCGEKFKSWNKVLDVVGSPPPMRGKDTYHSFRSFVCGITPAYAGKSR